MSKNHWELQYPSRNTNRRYGLAIWKLMMHGKDKSEKNNKAQPPTHIPNMNAVVHSLMDIEINACQLHDLM